MQQKLFTYQNNSFEFITTYKHVNGLGFLVCIPIYICRVKGKINNL